MSADDWERVDVSQWPIRGVEQAGSGRNLWLEDPETGVRWLQKDTVIPDTGIEQGEDWSEVVTTSVAALLGVPCAATKLCLRNGRRGSISRSVVPEGHSLNEGRVVLERAGVPGYFAHVEGHPAVDPERPEVRRPGHSLANVKLALADVEPPPGFSGPDGCCGFDVFAGYMLLDALVANRDRHEQNWAVLTPQLIGPPERLSPTYDHASSLGYNLPDGKRQLCSGDPAAMERWATRGTAYRFEHRARPRTLIDHAVEATQMASPRGADWWEHQVSGLDLEPVQEPLAAGRIPEMSHPAATFAYKLLTLNLRRLRDAIHQRS